MQKMFPEAVQGFSTLFSKVTKNVAISLKEKELIIVGKSGNHYHRDVCSFL